MRRRSLVNYGHNHNMTEHSTELTWIHDILNGLLLSSVDIESKLTPPWKPDYQLIIACCSKFLEYMPAHLPTPHHTGFLQPVVLLSCCSAAIHFLLIYLIVH